MKHWLTYGFLFIFSFQVLPIKQLGQWLYKVQLTEEVYEADCKTDENEPEKQVFGNYHKQYMFSINILQHSNQAIHTAIHFTEIIPASYVSDLFSPPPNQQA